MDIIGLGKRVRIYVGEADHWHGGALYLAILELLRREGCAGGTAIRGIAGFGASSRVHTATLLDVSADLPIVVEWVDTPEQVGRLLPKVKAMVTGGLITVEDAQIVHYQYHAAHDIAERLRVWDVMSRDVMTARADEPLRDAVSALVRSDYRALPVLADGGILVGIVTNGDLLERGGLGLRIELLRALSPEVLADELAASEVGKTVADVMTREVVTVPPDASTADAAHLMVQRHFKRLPVVDSEGRLLGMVSRVDLLRTASDTFARPEVAPPVLGRTIGEVMRRDVPKVRRDAPLAEVVDAVVSTRLNRALVVDETGLVLGGVTDAELIRRLSPEDHPGVLRVLASKLPFASLSAEERADVERATGMTAEQLMIPNISTVPTDTPIGEAIATMLREKRKILPVVDESGRLVGAVDRADLLRLLVEPPASAG